MVWPIVSGVIALGAFKCGVGKVYHPDVNPGVMSAVWGGAVCFLEVKVVIQGCRVLLGLLSIVNDKK